MELLCVKRKIKISRDGVQSEMPALIPAFRSQIDGMNKLSENRIITVKTKIARNVNQHNLFWTVVTFVFDDLPEDYEFKHVEQFVEWIKLEVGFCEVYKVAGKVRVYPKSMSFNLCEQTDFENNLLNPAFQLCSDIMGMTVDEMTMATKEYAGPNHRYRRK